MTDRDTQLIGDVGELKGMLREHIDSTKMVREHVAQSLDSLHSKVDKNAQTITELSTRSIHQEQLLEENRTSLTEHIRIDDAEFKSLNKFKNTSKGLGALAASFIAWEGWKFFGG